MTGYLSPANDTPMELKWLHPDDLPTGRMIIVKSHSGFVTVAVCGDKRSEWPLTVIDEIALERVTSVDGEVIDATRIDGWPLNMVCGWMEMPT